MKKLGFEFQGKFYETDEEGYLSEPDEWNPDVANYIAEKEEIKMNEQRWEVVNFLKDYYEQHQIVPTIKTLIEKMAKMFGPEKGNKKYLYDLFPGGPAKQACKIAGLPKPTGCV